MKKVMVFNFQTMQYEQASEAEGKEFLGLIESMNAECAAQQSVQPTGLRAWSKEELAKALSIGQEESGENASG